MNMLSSTPVVGAAFVALLGAVFLFLAGVGAPFLYLDQPSRRTYGALLGCVSAKNSSKSD